LKNGNKTFLKRVLIFFLGGMEMQCEEGGGRILLGDNTVGGAGILAPVRFQCVGVWI
jgi:hypothetical protein